MYLPTFKTRLTGSGLISRDSGQLVGFMVNSHSSGTLILYDNTAGSGEIIFNTITFAAGSGINYTVPFGINYTTGCFATLGGTADITFFYQS
jgi:hypothetical protein